MPHAPLRWLTGIGSILSAGSLIDIRVVFYRYLFTPYVPGYTSLAILVLFFGGGQILTAGLIGEYVGRTAQQVKGRPLYLVDELIGFEERPPLGPPRGDGSGRRLDCAAVYVPFR